MEKISNIVRGSSRVASVDLKKENAVRPGTPSFGRPIGESPQISDRNDSTASRAAALQLELNDAKKTGHDRDRVGEQMAEQFFVSKMRPQDAQLPISTAGPAQKAATVEVERFEPAEELANVEVHEAESIQPSGFTPRGSYVNVHA